MTSHENHFRKLLEEIEAGHGRSQRSLASQLGIALGLTNLLLKQVLRKGWIRIVQIRPNRVAYLITPTGMAEKAQMSRDYLRHSARSYASARDRLLDALSGVSAAWPDHGPPCRVAFYGAGEIAEIGYVCLQSTRLTLVGVVDETRTTPFFGLPVRRPHELEAQSLAGIPFDRLMVMDLDSLEAVERALETAGVPADAVFWLRDWRWDRPVSRLGPTAPDGTVELSRPVKRQAKATTAMRSRTNRRMSVR
jgi:hypothetical protein